MLQPLKKKIMTHLLIFNWRICIEIEPKGICLKPNITVFVDFIDPLLASSDEDPNVLMNGDRSCTLAFGCLFSTIGVKTSTESDATCPKSL